MTTKQYRAALDKLGMTQGALGELLRYDARTSRRYATGGVIPATVALLINMLLDGTITPEQIEGTKR